MMPKIIDQRIACLHGMQNATCFRPVEQGAQLHEMMTAAACVETGDRAGSSNPTFPPPRRLARQEPPPIPPAAAPRGKSRRDRDKNDCPSLRKWIRAAATFLIFDRTRDRRDRREFQSDPPG